LYPGDVIKLEQGDEVPADGFLMKVTNKRNCCYFDTTNINNDRNLVKKMMPEFTEGADEDDPIEFINLYVNNSVNCDPPSADPNSFNGMLKTVGSSIKLTIGIF
jgi:magnesium-transporting ATPase (P-type)